MITNVQIVPYATNNMSDLIFPTTAGKKLVLTPVADQLDRFVQSTDQPEAGGILLGRTILSSGDVIVDTITTPMDGDKQSRFSFFRSKKKHQKAIDQTWEDSKKTCNYLGEWHTHPEDFPSPSGTDTKNWKKRLTEDFVDDLFLYFVIVGTKAVHVWEGSRSTGNIVQLSQLHTPISDVENQDS